MADSEDTKVEIIWPKEYVEYNMKTMSKYAAAIAHLCKAAAILGEDDTEFLIFGITVIQTITVESAFKFYGVELAHDSGKLPDGSRWTYFYADVSELRKRLEEENEDRGCS